MTCANCGKPLSVSYRLVAFDRPRRINVPACSGRCNDVVRGWTGERLELHMMGQAIKPNERRYATS